tara:strand:- start:1071 stop:1583 length:513 start_codon:yes stop_codon:yes gene_type:complete
MAVTINGSTGITTPAEGIATSSLGNHGIIQVVAPAAVTTVAEITSTTWTDTGVTASITPRSNSNKIIIIVRQSLSVHRNTTSAYGGLRLLRDSTAILNTGDNSHYGIRADGNNDRWARMAIPFTHVDAPSSTSSITYKMQFKGHSASDGPEYKAQDDDAPSTIILMEVVA